MGIDVYHGFGQNEHLVRLLMSIAQDDGCASWNEWRRNNLSAVICLTGVDLSGANL
jgi:hypothetical protein